MSRFKPGDIVYSLYDRQSLRAFKHYTIQRCFIRHYDEIVELQEVSGSYSSYLFIKAHKPPFAFIVCYWYNNNLRMLPATTIKKAQKLLKDYQDFSPKLIRIKV